MSTVYVIYHSDTGNTEKLARLVAEGAGSIAGTEVKLVRAGELDYDAAAAADGIAIGSPDYFSYVAGQVKTFFDKALNDARFKGKPCATFGTHGGGAKVLGVLDALVKAVKLQPVAPGVLTKGAPDAKGAEDGRKLGKALAEAAK
jgi:multimeric flavodoxin WrbA